MFSIVAGMSVFFYHDAVCLLFPFNPLNAELNPICYLLALLAHHFGGHNFI